MHGAACPGVAAAPFVARRRRGHGPWSVPPWARRPATQRAGRAEPTPLSLHTGTHRDIARAHTRALCTVAAMTARGHGNDGESPGNTCHMTTGRGVLYQFFSWPLPFSPYWLLAGRAGQRRVSGTGCGDSRRTRVLLCVRSGSRPGGPRRQIGRPRCLCAPPRAPRVKGRQMAGKLPSRTRGRPLS
jgi:hypothetical protein